MATITDLLQPAGGGTAVKDQPVQSTIGVKAVSPTNNIPKPPTTLPKNQVAPKDLSSTYANVGGTIYNKQSQTKFANPADFFKDSGVNSFSNLKFDTSYAPSGKETVYGQQLPPTANIPPITPPVAQNPAPAAVSNPNTPPSTPTPYTPPNKGTTGVSQGGLIGNLINYAQNESPEVTKARANLENLQNNYAKQTANIEGSPIDLSLATGQEGILNRLFAAKQNAAQTALSSALTSQGQQIGATTSAGQLNAPITGVPYGTQTIQPSQPNGSTTSGAANINSLIGTRTGTDGKTTEYYNTQTGQGFANPQQLADFINQQIPGAGANSSNIFQLLKSGALNSSNSGGALNPLNNVQSIAQQVIAGSISPSQAYSMGGNVANWQGLLNQTIQQLSPGFDTAAAEGKYAGQQGVTTGQAQQKATYQSAQQQGQALASQLTDLINQFGLNPSDINAVNAGLQKIAQNTSDWRYHALSNYVNDIASRYAQILTPPGGTATDTTRSIASGMLDGTAKGTSLQTLLASLDQQAQAVIDRIQTPSITNSGNPLNLPGFNPGGSGPNNAQGKFTMGTGPGTAASVNNVSGLKSNGKFIAYSSPEESLQATINDLANKQSGNTKTGLNSNSTLLDLIRTWTGNPSGAYASAVSKDLGVPLDTPIGRLNTTQLALSIAKHETGYTA